MNSNMSLLELVLYFLKMYQKRDTFVLRDPMKRLGALAVAIGTLQDVIRKGGSRAEIESSLARVVSRIFRLSSTLSDHDKLTLVMAKKYPLNHCSYCQKLPCTCTENRPPSQEQTLPSEKQINWGLGDWTLHFKKVYGERNLNKGIENLLNRLFKEVTEIMIIELSIPNALSINTTIESIEGEYARELADTLAWTIAIANVLKIDLEQAVIERYKSGCPRCHNFVCNCIQTGFGDSSAHTIG